MTVEQPPNPLERLSFVALGLSPLNLTNFIHGLIEGLGHMEAVDDQYCGWAPLLDCPEVGFAHVGGGKPDPRTVFLGKHLPEELVRCFTPFTLADPHDALPVDIIHDRSVFLAFAIRDLIYAQCLDQVNAMAVPQPVDRAVKNVRHCRLGRVQYLGTRT